MSFSATILFTPPGPGAAAAGAGESPTPVEVSGQGLAVSGPDQLLHLIYQRLQSLAATAQEALSVARANQRLLRGLERQVKRLAGGPPSPLQTKGGPQEPGPAGSRGARASRRRTQPEAGSEVCEPLGSVPSPVGRVSPSPAPSPLGGLCPSAPSLEPQEELDVVPGSQPEGSEDSSGSNLLLMEDLFQNTFSGTPPALGSVPGFRTSTRGGGAKNTRRKRDVVLSKMVHNIHNHVSNDRRFNGAESIKSAWNMGVVKFLLERLKGQLASSPHPYTDKELKGACVAYFLTKRREYRNAMNPDRCLREREEKKLRSRRYRLFAARAAMVRLFSQEDQRLWEGASEELMSDEEDSPLEPGVWLARSPRFRSPQLTDLCRRLDANSRHGLRPNRMQGPPSDRLPSLPDPPLLLPAPGDRGPPYVQVKVEGDD